MFPYLRLHVLATPEPATLQRPGSGEPIAAPLLRRMLSRVLLEMHCPFNDPGRTADPPCQLKVGKTRRHATERCRQAASCPYGVLVARGLTQRVPFALHVTPRHDDGTVRVELTLYADAWKLYPWALAALERALADGLGARRQRRSFQIERVWRTSDGVPVAGRSLAGLPSALEPDLLSLEAPATPPPRTWTLEFLSPTRLIKNKRELRRGEDFGFDLLLSRTLERFRELGGDLAAAGLDAPRRRELEAAAGRVWLVGDETRWVAVRDDSYRRRKTIRLDGFVGRLTYELPQTEPETDFRPWLRAAEILHLGKNPAAGNGRLRWERQAPGRSNPASGMTNPRRARSLLSVSSR